jgi:hypothetical protein
MEEHPGPSPSKERRTWASTINRKKPWAFISSINNKKKTLDSNSNGRKPWPFPIKRKKNLGLHHQQEGNPGPPS